MSGEGATVADTITAPQYNPEVVGQVILIEVIERHPTRLTIDELALRIVNDPSDSTEVGAATEAIRDLRRACLVRYRNDDELVEPTQAALHAHKLFTIVA